MAQAGFTPLLLYYSTTASATPSAGNLANGELAINITDGKLFYKDNAGVVQVIADKNAGGGGVSSVSFGTTGLTPSTATSGAITVAGTLAVANGGTGVTTSTGSGSVVLSTSPVLTTPNLGTPSAATLTNATGLPISTGVSGLGTGVATALGTNTGVAGAFVVNGGALGTPSSGTLTNATGLPLSTGVTGTLAIANGGTNATDAATARTNLDVPGLSTANAFVGNQTITGTVTAIQAATQDAVTIQGRAGGTGSFITTIQPGNLAASNTVTLPNVTGTLASLGNVTQSFNGQTSFLNATLNFGTSTATSTIGLGNGATVNGATKTVNIGTGGVSGSTTTIVVGAAASGATSTTTLNGSTYIGGAAGTESLRVTPVASAVNYLEAIANTTGFGPNLYASGSDTNIVLNLISKGTSPIQFFTNGFSAVRQFAVAHTASAVNYVQATGGATGNAPILSAQGTDTNIDLSFAAKNTGAINFYANANDIGFKISSNGTTGNSWIAYGSSVSPILEASGASTNVNGIFRTKGSGVMAFRTNLVDEQLRIVHTASAVNYLQVTGGATGNAPTIFATGSDTNISLQYGSKGTGAHIFYTRGTTSNIQFNVSDVASAVNYWNIYGAATTGYPTLQVLGSDTNIGFVVSAKGTGPGVFQSASTQFQNTSGQVQFLVASAASAVNYVQASGSATGVDVALAAAGSDTNINLNLVGKGTGVVEANGIPVVTTTGTQTLTNKRVTPRVSTTTSSATPTINTDNVDQFGLTAQAVDITSFTTNLSGTPTDGQKLWIYIVGTAARAITWGASFEASTVPLPTTTVSTNRLDVGFVWNAATSKWRCVATA